MLSPFFQVKHFLQIFPVCNMSPVNVLYDLRILAAECGIEKTHALRFPHIVSLFGEDDHNAVASLFQCTPYRDRV